MLEIKKKRLKFFFLIFKNDFETNSPNVLFLFIYVYSVLKKTIEKQRNKKQTENIFFKFVQWINLLSL